MRSWSLPAVGSVVLGLGLLASDLPVYAQSSSACTYKPAVGQAGKDVVWAPTPDAVVDRMLQMAQVTPDDYLVDLGSGDGKIVIRAAQRLKVRGHGIEYKPDMVELSRCLAREARVTDRTRFDRGDIFKSDFSRATVITMYLLPELNIRKIEGKVRIGALAAGLRDPRLRGHTIAFDLMDDQGILRSYTGRIDGDHIEGSAIGPDRRPLSFTAVRVGVAPPIGGAAD